MTALPRCPFRPLANRIVVLRDEPFSRSPSGLLVIPDTAKSDRCEGVVARVGPGRQPWSKKGILPMSTEPGMRVFWSEHAGLRSRFLDMNFLKEGDERAFVLMPEEDLVGCDLGGKPQALFGWVFVERELPDQKTTGGIYIPDQAQEKKSHGRIVSVGPGPWNDSGTRRLPMFANEVPAGAEIVWPDYFGQKVHEPLQKYARPGHEIVVIPDEYIESVLE